MPISVAVWSLVKTGGILSCESIPASGAALRAKPRSRSKSAALCVSGQREERIDGGGFSPTAASVDVSGVDCPSNPAAGGCASTACCSMGESAVGGWRPTSALCCKIGFAGGDVFDDLI